MALQLLPKDSKIKDLKVQQLGRWDHQRKAVVDTPFDEVFEKKSLELFGKPYSLAKKYYIADEINKLIEAHTELGYRVVVEDDKPLPYKQIAEALTGYMIKKDSEPYVSSRGDGKIRWYGSNFGSCLRRQAYIRLKAPEEAGEFKPLWRITTHLGNMSHKFDQEELLVKIPGFLVDQPVIAVQDGIAKVVVKPGFEISLEEALLPPDARALFRYHDFSSRYDWVSQGGDVIWDEKNLWDKYKFPRMAEYAQHNFEKAMKQLIASAYFYRSPKTWEMPKKVALFQVFREMFDYRIYVAEVDDYAIEYVEEELQRMSVANEIIQELFETHGYNVPEEILASDNPFIFPAAQPERKSCFGCQFRKYCPNPGDE